MFVHKKRNVDIPKHYRVNFRIFYSLFFYCTLPRYYHRNRRKSTQNGENKNRNCETGTGWQENLSHGLDDVRVYLWAAWSRRWSHPLYADLKVLFLKYVADELNVYLSLSVEIVQYISKYHKQSELYQLKKYGL